MPGQLAQRNHAADRDAAAVDGWHELAVANPLVEVVLAARSSTWTLEQLDALLSPRLAYRRPTAAPHAARGPAEATPAKARNPKKMIETTTDSASSWSPTGSMLDQPS